MDRLNAFSNKFKTNLQLVKNTVQSKIDEKQK